MVLIGIISEALLYLCFALLMGSFLTSLIPKTHRPDIIVPKGIVMMAIGGIGIFSFVPVLQLLLFLYEGLGFSQILQSILFTFEVGKAWVFTFVLSNLFFIFVVWFDYRKKAMYAYIGIVFTLILIGAVGWSSHASSYDPVIGFFNHSAHFTAVSVWVGVLIVVSWFSNNQDNWLDFLKWYSPVALICVLITIVTGFLLMSVSVEVKDYPDSWLLPYGQALLVKHILLIPIVVYAVINSVLIKRKVSQDGQFNPRPWAKAESIILLLVFTATATLGQQAPPHETMITNESVASLFTLLYQGQFQSGMTVQLVVNATSLSFLVMAVLFLALMLISFIKKTPAIVSFFMGVLLVVSIYFGLVFSIV